MWRIIKISVASLLLLATIGLGVGLAYVQIQNGRILSVQSGSMTPQIKKGDLAIISSVSDNQLAVGNVVTFVNPANEQQTITHRIIGFDAGKIITQGDANPLPDEPIDKSLVVGQVQVTVPKLGFVFDFIRRPIGLLIAVYVPALLIVVAELKRLSDYYASQRPYMAPGYRRRIHLRTKKSLKPKIVATMKMTGWLLLIGLAFAIPSRAALSSQATLANNSISVLLPQLADHILIRRVEFRCSLDNTGSLNRLPELFFYNPARQDVPTGGWYVESQAGRLVTFLPQTVFDARDNYDIEPDLIDGLNYEGDYLALFNAAGELIDAVSWGTDTTYLNPALVGASEGTAFRRIDIESDTNTVADWAVTVEQCSAE